MNEIIALLAAIDAVLVRGDAHAHMLWSLLTALRGPDVDSDEAYEVKDLTTARLRATLFPDTARFAPNLIADFNEEPPVSILNLTTAQKNEVGDHFMQHYILAMYRLTQLQAHKATLEPTK